MKIFRSLSFMLLLVSLVSFAMEPNSARAFMLVHGFSSSSFEWTEAQSYISNHCPSCHVSLVSLGKHATPDEFKAGTWQEWGEPIVSTYESLSASYNNITLVLSSAGASLFLEQISRPDASLFKNMQALNRVIFVDPFIIPKSNFLWLAPYLKMLPSAVVDREKPNLTPEEKVNSHVIQPIEALAQLQNLREIVYGRLQKTILLPAHLKLYILHADQDPVVDASTVEYLSKHLSANLYITKYNSNLHVFTRLRGRSAVSDQDRQNQKAAFEIIFADALGD